MSHSAALTAFALGVLLAAGCYEKNLAYDPDAQSCKSSSPACPAAAPICDDDNVCVQCTQAMDEACVGDKPICDNDARSCRGCTKHSECDSGVCTPSGACAAQADVAYVEAGKTSPNGMCERAAPCPTVWFGMLALKPFVKVAPGLVKGNDATVIDRPVTIIGEAGVVIDRDGDGPIFNIQGKSGATVKVTMTDVEITGSSMGDAIAMTANGGPPTLILNRVSIRGNQGAGITANAGNLQVYRSKLSDNTGGGINLSGNATFQIISNFFLHNGGSTVGFGGISITSSANADNRLELNTFHRNEAQNGVGSAVFCNGGSFTARNNILFGNTTGSNMQQATGTCAHAFSIVAPGPMPSGSNLFTDDPKFLDGENGDLHISPTSPARGKADPNADLTGEARIDIDGEVRKSPADLGADQIP